MFLPTVSVRYSHTKSIRIAVLWLLDKASIFYQEMHCFCLHYRLKYVFGLLTNDHCEYARWGEKVSVFPRQQCQKLESINGQELLLESTLWFKHKKVCLLIVIGVLVYAILIQTGYQHLTPEQGGQSWGWVPGVPRYPQLLSIL